MIKESVAQQMARKDAQKRQEEKESAAREEKMQRDLRESNERERQVCVCVCACESMPWGPRYTENHQS
jgi:hypothetical protein